MKIATVIARAQKCSSDKEARDFLDWLIEQVEQQPGLKRIPFYPLNEDHQMEDSSAFVSFELNRIISDKYITRCYIQVRDGVLSVNVKTYYMADGLGLHSRNFWVAEGLDDDGADITANEDWTMAQLSKMIYNLVIADHTDLLVQLGLTPKAAQRAVIASL